MAIEDYIHEKKNKIVPICVAVSFYVVFEWSYFGFNFSRQPSLLYNLIQDLRLKGKK